MKIFNLFLLSIMFMVSSLLGNELTATAILKKSIDISSPNTMQSYSKQTVYFKNGRERTFEILSYSKDKNEKSLMIYKKPARVKGDKFLFLKGGNIWVYFSKTGRIRRIASSAKKSKMQGSDFSYEDMSLMSSLATDYIYRILDHNNSQYIIQLLPKKNSSYNKLIAYIDDKKFMLNKLEFYKENKLTKFLLQDKFKKIDEFYIPTKIIMESVNGSRTEIETLNFKINTSIKDSFFYKNSLGR